MRGRRAALSGDHGDGTLGKCAVAIHHQHARARARQQDCRRAAIANAVARRPAPRTWVSIAAACSR
jgi:hypothetical protein